MRSRYKTRLEHRYSRSSSNDNTKGTNDKGGFVAGLISVLSIAAMLVFTSFLFGYSSTAHAYQLNCHWEPSGYDNDPAGYVVCHRGDDDSNTYYK